VWCLAREADDDSERLAGQVPRRRRSRLSDQLGLRQGERRTARDEPEAPRRPRPVALRGTGDCSQLSGGAGAWGGDVNQAHAGPALVGDAAAEQPRRKEWKRRLGACVHGLDNVLPSTARQRGR